MKLPEIVHFFFGLFPAPTSFATHIQPSDFTKARTHEDRTEYEYSILHLNSSSCKENDMKTNLSWQPESGK